jgi:hypothetical protein
MRTSPPNARRRLPEVAEERTKALAEVDARRVGQNSIQVWRDSDTGGRH